MNEEMDFAATAFTDGKTVLAMLADEPREEVSGTAATAVMAATLSDSLCAKVAADGVLVSLVTDRRTKLNGC